MGTFTAPPWTPEMGPQAETFITAQLPTKYLSGVDDLGLTRWPSDWRTYRGNGASPDEAFSRVAQNIDEIRAGVPTTIWTGPFDVPWAAGLDVDGPLFLTALRNIYLLDPSAQPGGRPVDGEGYCRWSSDYRIHRANGSSHEAATRRVTNDIFRIWGLPPLPVGPNGNLIRGILWTRNLEGTITTVVYGKTPVAAPCAIETACQYHRIEHTQSVLVAALTDVQRRLQALEWWEDEPSNHMGFDVEQIRAALALVSDKPNW